MKINNVHGEQKISPSAFARASLIGAQVRANDIELERYRVYISGQISNQIQLITDVMTAANNAQKIDDNLLITLAEKVDVISGEMNQLLAPLETHTQWH